MARGSFPPPPPRSKTGGEPKLTQLARGAAQAEAEWAKREIELKLAEAETTAQLAEIDVNKMEAQHRSMFVAGWRPALGWLGVAYLAYSLILYNLMCWALALAGSSAPPPPSWGCSASVVCGLTRRRRA
jgi:hypothetical protein